MASSLNHPSLGANLKGLEVKFDGATIIHYRGIQYGKISRRFAKAELTDEGHDKELDCTRFG